MAIIIFIYRILCKEQSKINTIISQQNIQIFIASKNKNSKILEDFMKKQFTASVWQEDDWYVAHCNEFEIASQGKSVNDALKNLQEAIELYFEEPTPTLFPAIYNLEAEVYYPRLNQSHIVR